MKLRYLQIEAKRQWRNRETLIFRLGLPTAIYLLLTLVQGDAFNPNNGAAEIGRMVALAALAAVISGLAPGPSLGEDRGSGWLRQLQVTPLKPGAAVAAKMAVSMSFALPAIAMVAAAAVIVEGITLEWAQWAELIGLMWIATTPLTALGTLIGLAFSPEAAQSATTLAFLVLWLLGGLFTSPNNMPDALAAVAKTLPSYGIFELGQSVATGMAIRLTVVALLAAWTVGAGALATLAWRRVTAT